MSDRLVTTAWVAKRLCMSPSWVKVAARDGRLPCIRIPDAEGRPSALRFDPDEIERVVESWRAAWRPGDSSAETMRRAGTDGVP